MSLASETGADTIRRWREHPVSMVRELFDAEPDPWQLEVLECFPFSPRIAMKACKGPGKAQPVDTVIPTPDGERRFGDLRVGDRVFAGDGTITTVIGVYDRGERAVYRVRFDDGSSTRACSEHLWKVRGRTERRHDTWSVLSTAEILARGVREKNGRWSGRHFEIPRQGAVDLPETELPIAPYVLGVWLGDGVRLKGAYATKPIPEIQARIESMGYRTRLSVDDLVTVYGIVPHLRALDVLRRYSHERHIPHAYKWAGMGQRLQLLLGLMDTDGGIDADGHTEFASTSEQLAADVVWLVRSLGGVAYVKDAIKQPFYYDTERNKVMGRPCYRVTVRTGFNPFTVAHKAARYRDPFASPSSVRYLTRKLDAIEPDGVAHCVCISVAHPDQLYLTEDFIVTHNTAVLAWLVWNFLLTRPMPKIVATSISGDNLRDNLWSELSKWQMASKLLQKYFTWTVERLSANEAPAVWYASARTWSRSAAPDQQANTLAGVHADYVMAMLDESGGIPDAVMATAEGIGSSAVEYHIVQAGNPTHLEGPLYRATTSERHLWRVFEITADPDDPKRTSRVSVKWAREQIEKYGRDNPWVLVNVFGQFPPSSLNALIGPDEVNAVLGKHIREDEYTHAPRVLGVDVARFGDDSSIIFPRQGRATFTPIAMRNATSVFGAGAVARKWMDWQADACFIDATGGYGGGWIDNLVTLGRSPIQVQFAGKSSSDRYFNKRAEIWFAMCEAIKAGMVLPNLPEIVAELTTPTYSFKGSKLLVEDKDQIKQRLGRSPDYADALACTFAEPVHVSRRMFGMDVAADRSRALTDYDPYGADRL